MRDSNALRFALLGFAVMLVGVAGIMNSCRTSTLSKRMNLLNELVETHRVLTDAQIESVKTEIESWHSE